MKKIIKSMLIILAALTLASCINTNIYQTTKKDYLPQTDHEEKVVNTIKEIKDYGVIITSLDLNIGSGIIFKKNKEQQGYKYYAITSSSNIENNKHLKVMTKRNTAQLDVTRHTTNIDTGLSIIEFHSYINLEVLDVSNINLYNIQKGQSIISQGSPGYRFDTKYNNIGKITNIESSMYFTHNAASNIGQIGGGVFDLQGNLIGINIDIIQKMNNIISLEYQFGITKAIHIDYFYNLILNFDENLLNYKYIPNTYLKINTKKTTNYISDNAYEKNIIAQTSSLEKYIVEVRSLNEVGTGLIYDKEKDGDLYTYYVITKQFKFPLLSMDINYNTKKYRVKKHYDIKNMYLSILEFKTTEDIPIYYSKAINELKGIDIKKGQEILSISNNQYGHKNILSNGYLSLEKTKKPYLFMHDIPTMISEYGAPMFNLEGELIGFKIDKVDKILTSEEQIAAEGLSYGLDINYIAPLLKEYKEKGEIEYKFNLTPLEVKEKYESHYKEEKTIMDTIEKVKNSVVTVKALNSHGSGVIVKKEKYKDEYLYYVLTNEHVVEGEKELTIHFNELNVEISGYDFVQYPEYDFAIIRFKSKKDFAITELPILKDQIETKPIPGQKVIVMGTPYSLDNNNYITVGNIIDENNYYMNKRGLEISHDAAINPGNSGGPLLNLKGEIIGLNVSKLTSILHPQGNIVSQKVGFALNINILAEKLNSTKQYQYKKLTVTPRLGIIVTNSNDFIDDTIEEVPKGAGVLILEIDEFSISYGKLEKYDLIYEINGNPINDIDDFPKLKFDKDYNIKIRRIVDGKTISLTVNIVITK